MIGHGIWSLIIPPPYFFFFAFFPAAFLALAAGFAPFLADFLDPLLKIESQFSENFLVAPTRTTDTAEHPFKEGDKTKQQRQ